MPINLQITNEIINLFNYLPFSFPDFIGLLEEQFHLAFRTVKLRITPLSAMKEVTYDTSPLVPTWECSFLGILTQWAPATESIRSIPLHSRELSSSLTQTTTTTRLYSHAPIEVNVSPYSKWLVLSVPSYKSLRYRIL